MKSDSGYYIVNNKKYRNKIKAITDANSSNSQLQWYFNDEILNQQKWTEEPDISLQTLYFIRAQQIRQSYDYVILFLSGGADSTNMLNAFLNQNLLPDEIIVSAPLKGTTNLKIDKFNHDANNIISETFLAQKPLFNEIQQKYGHKIRCTVNDYFEDMINISENWLYEQSNHWIHPSGGTRWPLDKFSHIRLRAESGQRIAVVLGLDKPIICRADSGNLYTVLTDAAVMVVPDRFIKDCTNVETVLFYYTADLPEIMIKQSHVVCKWLYQKNNSQIKEMILWDRSKNKEFNRSPDRGSLYQRLIVPEIYPSLGDFYKKVWTANTQSAGLTGGMEVDSWIFKMHNNMKFIEVFNSDLKSFLKNLDLRFLDDPSNIFQGLRRYYKYWHIGHENQFSESMSNLTFDKDINFEL